MTVPTKDQVYAGLRYSGVVAGTVGSLFVFLGAMDQQTSQSAIDAFRQMLDGMQQFLGGAYKFVYVLAPVVTIWLAKIGWNSASPKNQIASVQALPQAQVIVTDPKLAEGIPGVKVETK